ncbi:hypothetical protein [Nocardiopsis synnemataformans]|uniref:hypothetical protein n=1 Tax=Nocardiopsis synnemataformans TaxID=61305 RepID=UPI003EB85C2B
MVEHGIDNGGAPYVTVRIVWKREGQDVPVEIRATWHTRTTGTYRLSSAIARWERQDWHDISITKACTLVADGAELEPAPEEAPDPAQEWARVWGDPQLAGDLGAKLTCEEAEVVADLLATLGMPRQALAWLVEHAQDDDEDDAHWDLRQQYPNGYQ